jgi:hypothetical protein
MSLGSRVAGYPGPMASRDTRRDGIVDGEPGEAGS